MPAAEIDERVGIQRHGQPVALRHVAAQLAQQLHVAVLLLCLLAWGGTVWTHPPAAFNIWILRDQLILLTGLGAYALMALIMLLAVRPRWIESRLGGLDKMYRPVSYTHLRAHET